MVRSVSIDNNGMKKGAWTEEEDNKLRAYIQRYGHWNWRLLPKFAGLARCGKSCRLRWKNYLRPGVKRGNFTKEEEDLIVHLHAQMGNKWSAIAAKLPGRTDNEVKNFWHTRIEKRCSKRNPAAKNKGHTNEDSRVEVLEEHKYSETQTDLSSMDAGRELGNSVNQSLDSNFSVHSNAEFQEFDFWTDPFLTDTTDYYRKNEYISHIDYGELLCSDLSYLNDTDWITEYDHSAISTDHSVHKDPFQEKNWSELFAWNAPSSQN